MGTPTPFGLVAGATNGTRVNGVSITSAVLADGDEVQFGDVKFRFELVK